MVLVDSFPALTRVDCSAPWSGLQGWCDVSWLEGLALEVMAFPGDFVTAVAPVEPLTFNVCQGSMPVGVVKAIGRRVKGGLGEWAIQGCFHG